MTAARKTVLFLIPTLTGGGAERVIVTLLTHLDRSRFQPMLAVVDMRGEVFRKDIPADVEFIDLQATRVRYALPRILRLIWRRRPDIVFSTLSHLNLALSIIRPMFPRPLRSIARESCVISKTLETARFPRLWRWLYRRFYARHDLLVCQSRDMQDDLTQAFGIPTSKSVLINNPVDVRAIRAKAGAPVSHPAFDSGGAVLVAAGRLEPQKGFDLLVEAMAQLADPQVQLVILGEGPGEGALRALARDKSVGERVHFPGFQANPYAWFARADAFVLSSRYEGFPNVVLEALACGTPVIATPAPGGINELLAGREGCVVANAITAPALAAAIDQWLGGSRARIPVDAVEPYGVERIVRQYETILEEDSGQNPGSPTARPAPRSPGKAGVS